jgi:Sulfotransferase domain
VRRALRPVKRIVRGRRFRHATSRARILPSFIIIGAQRAGTTSLFDYLGRHPDVASPTAVAEDIAWSKEIHFFDDRFTRGLDWYRALFPLAVHRRYARARGRDLVAAEATPYYLFHPAVPARIASTLPDVRLIALLRDPIERAYSHYQLAHRKGREQLSFEEALAAEPERIAEDEPHLDDPTYRTRHHRHHSYLARGMYADQLERWFAHFPREQLLIIRSEDFLSRPAEIYADTLAFLGLRSWRLDHFEQRNRGSYAPIDPALRARLEEHFAEPNARLERLLGRELGWGGRAAVTRGAGVASTPAD